MRGGKEEPDDNESVDTARFSFTVASNDEN